MLVCMSMTMRVIIMAIPRMTHTLKTLISLTMYASKSRKCVEWKDENRNRIEQYQEHSAVLLSPVENPKPVERLTLIKFVTAKACALLKLMVYRSKDI